MAAHFDTCPKCHHRRQPGETAEPGTCPACGLVFAKWVVRDSFVPRKSHEAGRGETPPRSMLAERLLDAPRPLSSMAFWGRALLLVFFLIWGWRLAAMDLRTAEINRSFMHAIVLPFHEAGHVIFMPFGEFMSIAGGSLFQLLMPLCVGAALLIRNRDPYGAALGLWWCGASLVDLAPYIYDAADPIMLLLGGHTGEDGPHDWIYLLEAFGKIAHSPSYGLAAQRIGIALMLAGLVWAGAVLLRQRAKPIPNDAG